MIRLDIDENDWQDILSALHTVSNVYAMEFDADNMTHFSNLQNRLCRVVKHID